MNNYVRIIFLPIMLLAGIFTGTMCTLIIAPIALGHWLRERRLIANDLKMNEIYIKNYHQELEAAIQERKKANN